MGKRTKAPTRSIKKLAIVEILTEGGTRTRAGENEATIAEYTEIFRNPEELGRLPEPVVYYDGTHYWLSSGFHRLAAAKRAKFTAIDCEVRRGDELAAFVNGIAANAANGLPRSNADKRYTVREAFKKQTIQGKSDKEIGRICCVSHTFVASIRAELTGDGRLATVASRQGADGRTIDTTKIAEANKERAEEKRTARAVAEHPGELTENAGGAPPEPDCDTSDIPDEEPTAATADDDPPDPDDASVTDDADGDFDSADGETQHDPAAEREARDAERAAFLADKGAPTAPTAPTATSGRGTQPAPPPTPKLEPKDENGVVIPERLRGIWRLLTDTAHEASADLRQLANTWSEGYEALNVHVKKTGNAGGFPPAANVADTLITGIRGALGKKLREMVPHAVCPDCGGAGCAPCASLGWFSAGAWAGRGNSAESGDQP